MSAGATPQDWQRLVDADLTADLLPVVSDTNAPIHPESKLKDIGKTPSRFNGEFVVGIPKWTEQRSTERDVKRWAIDSRLGICIQTRRVRAIDVDIADLARSAEVRGVVEALLGTLPVRSRSNSGKLLLAFTLEGDLRKRIIRTPDGLIEFLATGQQFIAHGTHPSGSRYEWEGLEVLDALGEFPVVDLDDFDVLWEGLANIYGNSTEVRAGMVPEVARRAEDVLDDVVTYLGANDWTRGFGPDGRVYVTCPWKDGHSSDSGETESAYFPAGLGGFTAGHYKCLHASCAHRTDEQFLDAIGYTAAQFEEVRLSEGERKAPLGSRRGVPEANHLTSDQANAGRITKAFGRQLIVVAGQWYAWTGRRWQKDDGEVYRCGCKLSNIIHAEADGWRAKRGASSEETEKYAAIADSLVKWAHKSEMKASIEAAVGLAKKMLAVDEAQIDSDPWLLNCLNGTVDLRTGKLKPHDPSDYITKLVPVAYDPDARSEVWEATVAKVTMESGMRTRPLANFLQRWFGYCATGSTREQSFLVHYGSGSNGKSTILDTIADVLGDYAATAAPGLLVAGKHGSDHPTGMADLFGRRMVTSHESGEGAYLKEDVVKQLTGSDKVKARFISANFFEFDPTHKLQLLTNHKPLIKGQDNGIWRRVLLMPYMARFASAEDVAAGRAHYVKDTAVGERLKEEKAGVLAWLVQGAKTWAQDGLQPPDAVLAASRDYQTEQDRVGQFLAECCELDPMSEAPLTHDFGGLYNVYRDWCAENGQLALSKPRFVQELERCVPGFAKNDAKVPGVGGSRRKILQIRGVRLLERG